MLIKSEAIVLRTIPYSDSKWILNCYTPEYGKMAFINYRSKGRKKQHSGYFHPLAIIEIEYNYRQRKQVYPAKNIQHQLQLQSLLANPFKQSMSLFLSEFLNFILKDEEANHALYRYVVEVVDGLNRAKEGYDLFHLKFILELSVFTGFFPEIQLNMYRVGCCLNLMSGEFDEEEGSLTVSPEGTQLLLQLAKLTYSSLKDISSTAVLRTEGLNALMRFYTMHFPEFKIPVSLKIFRGY